MGKLTKATKKRSARADKISAIKSHTINMHKQRFVTQLFEYHDISIVKEFAQFYKQTRTMWLKAMNAKVPDLPSKPTVEQIREHGFAVRGLDRERHRCWAAMMQVLQTMMKYSLPTFKSQELKVSAAKKAVFNFNLGSIPGGAGDDATSVVDVTPEDDDTSEPPALPCDS